MLRIFLTGLAMGAADVVPGVSGGTIAFISGIYLRLLNAIRSVPSALPVLFRDGIKAAWNYVDGQFLLILGSGIIISVLSLARLITWLLATYPTVVWAFFFGLIIASSVYLASQVRWRWQEAFMLVFGVLFALGVGEIRPTELEPTTAIIFFSGALAICAMILPGISGSFILLIIGMYPAVMAALKGFDLVFIAVFAGGCLCGLLGFSHLLAWLLERFKDPIIAMLTGFLAGSLMLVWPWQHAVDTYTKPDGRVVTLASENVLPSAYAQLTSQDPQTAIAVGLMLLGGVLVFALSRLAPPADLVER